MSETPRIIFTLRDDDVSKLDALKALFRLDTRSAVLRKLLRDAAATPKG